MGTTCAQKGINFNTLYSRTADNLWAQFKKFDYSKVFDRVFRIFFFSLPDLESSRKRRWVLGPLTLSQRHRPRTWPKDQNYLTIVFLVYYYNKHTKPFHCSREYNFNSRYIWFKMLFKNDFDEVFYHIIWSYNMKNFIYHIIFVLSYNMKNFFKLIKHVIS